MIERLVGKLLIVDDDHQAVIMVGGVGYGVSLAPIAAAGLVGRLGQETCIYTVYFIQGAVGTGSLVPTLVGFQHPTEREFYRLLLQVGGLGPRGALKALGQPPAAIARAIATNDQAFLRQLPGVGGRRAGNIVQQLQDKVTPFLPADDTGRSAAASPNGDTRASGGWAIDSHQTAGQSDQGATPDVLIEVLTVLAQLGYSDRDAQRLLAAVSRQQGESATAAELIQEIFRRPKGGALP